jgi:phosphoribosyl 1,2-cyclic phosphodiesterase
MFKKYELSNANKIVILPPMALHITSLNTGSNGNCFYIGNTEEAILVDVGLTCKETEIRMSRLGLNMAKVKAIFISHEHTDHIKGLAVLSKKYQLPVYITTFTLSNCKQQLQEHLIKSFVAHQPIAIGKLHVLPFQKHHDAIEPHSFIITCNNVTVGVFTDIGSHCDNLISNFKKCHAAFLEANYDDEMLEKGSYPYFLKNRIRSPKGHLSNRQALDLFLAHRPNYMTHLFLSHLSKDNNCPNLVYDLFHQEATGVEIIVAPRTQETAVYYIENRLAELLSAV